MTNRMNRRFERGFNLVEVMVAMAILGSVLLSIITLFFLGRANVYSGKQMTRAMSVAVHANEDLSALYPRELFTAFGIDNSTTKGSNPVAGVTYTNSLRFDTTQAGTAVDVGGYLARWKSLIPADQLLNGKVSLVLIPLSQDDVNDVTTARVIQVRIITEWDEGVRKRNVIVDSTKLNR